jgi:hypothetical protein
MSAQYDITAEYLIRSSFRPIHAGDDYDHSFMVERPPGTPLELTGAKIWFTVKQEVSQSDEEALLQYTTDDNSQIEIIDAPGGAFVIHLKSDDTGEMAGSWIYDIQVKLGTGKVITIARGVIEFLPQVTQNKT